MSAEIETMMAMAFEVVVQFEGMLEPPLTGEEAFTAAGVIYNFFQIHDNDKKWKTELQCKLEVAIPGFHARDVAAKRLAAELSGKS